MFGGLTFGGGPIANYMSHAIVSMVDRLRAEGRYGFLFANGGFATDNHCIVLGSEPIAAASFPQDFDYQAEAEAKRGPVPELVEDYAGPATIESYTVFYGRDGAPKAGVVVARTPEDKRTLAHVDVGDAAMLAFLTDGTQEPVGTAGQVVALDEGFGWRAPKIRPARVRSGAKSRCRSAYARLPDRQLDFARTRAGSDRIIKSRTKPPAPAAARPNN